MAAVNVGESQAQDLANWGRAPRTPRASSHRLLEAAGCRAANSDGSARQRRVLDGFTAQHFGNIGRPSANASRLRCSLAAVVAERAGGRTKEFRSQEASNLVRQHATPRYPQEWLTQATMGHRASGVSGSSSQGSANTCWHPTRAEVHGKPLFAVPGAMQAAEASVLEASELSAAARAFAATQSRQGPASQTPSAACAAGASGFGPQHLASTLQAPASLSPRQEPPSRAAPPKTVASASSFSPQGLANTLQAARKSPHEEQPPIQTTSDANTVLMPGSSCKELAAAAWGLATASCRGQSLPGAACQQATLEMSEPTEQSPANTVWEPSACEHGSKLLADALASAGLETASKLTADSFRQFRKANGSERPVNLHGIIYGLAAFPGCLEASGVIAAAVAAVGRRAAVMDGPGAVDDSDSNSKRKRESSSNNNNSNNSNSNNSHSNSSSNNNQNINHNSNNNNKITPLRCADYMDAGPPLRSETEEPRILLQQPHVCVLWKPPGWTVSIAGGIRDEAIYGPAFDLNEAEVQGRSKPLQDWVSRSFGASCPIARDPEADHGLIHRLDSGTSGTLLLAKTYLGYHLLLLQLVAGQIQKEYLCLCQGHVDQMPGRRIQTRLKVVGQGAGRRSAADASGRPACTEILAVTHLECLEGKHFSLVEVRLHTGRKHQIRAHFASEGHPLVRDRDYGGPAESWCPRIFLHASRLRLASCSGGGSNGVDDLDVRSELPRDLQQALTALSTWKPGR
ncbi:unnamed protein product, partial [Polarella glacialis]